MKISRQRKAAWVGVGLLTLAALWTKWHNATNPRPGLEWERSALWWEQGRCRQCHEPLKPGSPPRQATSPPRYHQDLSWRFIHGRSQLTSEERCLSCHQQSTCRDCHAIRPETHTRDFCRPGGDNSGAHRHAILAAARPSACLVCHGSFFSTCAACHPTAQLRSLNQQGEEGLKKWGRLRFSP